MPGGAVCACLPPVQYACFAPLHRRLEVLDIFV
nr:MAG TPA: hypothetical protein [Caudoviricetes sp.]